MLSQKWMETCYNSQSCQTWHKCTTHSSVEEHPLQRLLQWIRPEGNIYWRTKKSIQTIMRSFWSSRKSSSFRDLAGRRTSLANPHDGLKSWSLYSTRKPSRRRGRTSDWGATKNVDNSHPCRRKINIKLLDKIAANDPITGHTTEGT